MATLKIVLRTDKNPDSDGAYQLHLRISHKRSTRYIKLFPFNLPEDQWSYRTESIRAAHPRHASYNQKIKEVFNEAQETVDFYLMDHRDATVAELKKEILKQRQKSDKKGFIAFSKEIIQGFRDEDRVRYANRCSAVIVKLEEFAGGEVQFDEMDVSFLRRFKTHLFKVRGNSQNTVYGNFKVMRTFYRQAIMEGLANQGDNPFFLFKVKKEAVHKDHLSMDHLVKMSKLKLDGRADLVRDSFLFSFWCAGIRFSDICKLEWPNIHNNNTLVYTMGKTKASEGSKKYIELSPPAMNILQKYNKKVKKISHKNYIFPWLDGDKKYTAEERVDRIGSLNAYGNSLLKDIAKEIEFDGRLTFHISRHTFTSVADEVADLSVKQLQALLGHSDSRTTEVYRNSLNRKKDIDAMNKFYDNIKSNFG